MTRARLAVPLALALAGAARAGFQPPHVVVLVADDLGWNDLGCYGNAYVRTPNLDRLAREGMRFERAFLTSSSCSPSRASILTGRYPHATGAAELHQPLPPDQTTIAGLLKAAGYYTVAAGKWHLGPAARRDFDHILPARGPSGCEHWVRALRERPRDRPLFAWLAAVDPHRPYAPRAQDPPHDPARVVVPPFLPDVPPVRADLAAYYDEIARLDGFVGAVLEELDRQGIARDTLVVFLSDNGRPFPRCKTTLFDSGIRTPLLVRWPARVRAGVVCAELVSLVDLAPTLAELAGLEPVESFQGRSFARLLADPLARGRRFVFAERNWHDYRAHERAVRTRRFLYVENALPELPRTPPADAVRSPTFRAMQELEARGELPAVQRDPFVAPRPRVELYALDQDPFQLRNRARDPALAPVRQRLRAELAAWRRRTGDSPSPSTTPDRFDRRTGRRLPGTGPRRKKAGRGRGSRARRGARVVSSRAPSRELKEHALNKTKSTLVSAAVAGLLLGCSGDDAKAPATPGAQKNAPTSKPSAPSPAAMADKHVCKGRNACKGKGGCKSGDNGCAGKNSCKGKGGCATVEHHSCKGQNDCKGQGGCGSGDNGCAGKNSCKGKGGCAVPVKH